MTTPNDLDAHVPKALEDYRDVILLEFEVVALTGYKQPDRQLAELRKQGFYRARQNPVTRRVILERAHYQAVCAEVFNNQVHRLPPRKQNENKRLTPKNT